MLLKRKSTKEKVRSGYSEPDDELDYDDGEPSPPKKKKNKQKSPKKRRSGGLLSVVKTKPFIGGCCIALSMIITFGAVPLLKAQTTDLVKVQVFAKSVHVGEQISKDDVKTVEMSSYNLPLGIVYEQKEVVGSFVTQEAAKGDLVTRTRLSQVYPGDDPALASLPEGKQAVAVTLSDMSQSLASKLRHGDIIQIYAMLADETNSATLLLITPPQLQYIEVLYSSDEIGADVSAAMENRVQTITLLANEQQAQQLVTLEHTATLHAALITRGDEQRKKEALEKQEQYFLDLEQAALEEDAPPEQPPIDGAQQSAPTQ